MKPKRGILLGAVVAAVAVAAVMGYNLYRHPAAFRTLTDGTLPAQAVQARREQLAERDDLRVLVAYFSHSGTTKGVATALSQQVGADLFAITPQVPYTNVYTQSNREIRTGARPALAGELPNLADYDVVFVGYPSGGTPPRPR